MDVGRVETEETESWNGKLKWKAEMENWNGKLKLEMGNSKWK